VKMNIKRIFDFFFALICLIVSFPIWLMLAFLIKFQDMGPVFYTQDRVGKNGRIFKSLKFRSMAYDAAKDTFFVQAKESDQRVTKIGALLRATALDELPQLINILKADMSFVGPRALVAIEKEVHSSIEKSIFEVPGFKERSIVRPGLTGIAQIFAPRDIDREKKFKYDIWYIKNQNFLLDLYIIIVSFFVTFMGRWETREDKFKILTKKFHLRLLKELQLSV